MANRTDNVCAIYIDMGTTTTRAWLVDRREILARGRKPVGVRDTARDGSPARLHSGLAELIAEVRIEARAAALASSPQCIVAAGMCSSALGLAELPHTPAPAGISELAAGARWFEFPHVTDLPVLLIPGVRCGPSGGGPDLIGQMDVMRGEETLCIGLLETGWLAPPAVVVNLGSHWKAICIDADGRIAASITSLSGELIHAAQTQTILASSVASGRPSQLSREWVAAGMREQRRSGLPRALFCVRLLELSSEGAPEDRLAFLVGAFVAADLDNLSARGFAGPDMRVVITGGGAAAETWRDALNGESERAVALTPAEVDEAMIAGLASVRRRKEEIRPSF